MALREGLDVTFRADVDVVDGVRLPVRDEGENAVVQADEILSSQFHDPVDVVVTGVGVDGDEVDGPLWEVRN